MGTSDSKDSTSSSPELAAHNLTSQCREAIAELCQICGKEDDGGNQRPLNIVSIGKHGAGKSSFINGVAAALSEDRWREHAYTGDLGRGAPVTIVTQRLEKCCNGDREQYQNVLLPTLIDVAGLSNETDDKLEELLRLLFYGHIEDNEPLMKVYEDIKDRTEEDIRLKYSLTYPEMRVDRVVFVASASAEDPLPVHLMGCVHRAAQPSHHRDERRAVPLYGVLTKMDKADLRSSAYQEKRKDFMRFLGLNQTRFLVCSNYCDDLDPQGQRSFELRPELDLPVLQFVQQVCDRARRVVEEEEVLPGSGARTVADKQNAARVMAWEDRDQQRREGLAARWRALDPIHRHVLGAVALAVPVLAVLLLFLLDSVFIDPQSADWAKQLRAASWYFVGMSLDFLYVCFVSNFIIEAMGLIMKGVREIMKGVRENMKVVREIMKVVWEILKRIWEIMKVVWEKVVWKILKRTWEIMKVVWEKGIWEILKRIWEIMKVVWEKGIWEILKRIWEILKVVWEKGIWEKGIWEIMKGIWEIMKRIWEVMKAVWEIMKPAQKMVTQGKMPSPGGGKPTTSQSKVDAPGRGNKSATSLTAQQSKPSAAGQNKKPTLLPRTFESSAREGKGFQQSVKMVEIKRLSLSPKLKSSSSAGKSASRSGDQNNPVHLKKQIRSIGCRR